MNATQTTARRTRITTDGNDVILRRWDAFEDRVVTTTYYVAGFHGYVRDRKDDCQVCRGLYSTGETLECYRADLLAVIRHEYDRRVRGERAERNR